MVVSTMGMPGDDTPTEYPATPAPARAPAPGSLGELHEKSIVRSLLQTPAVCEVLVGPGMAGAALSLQTWAVMLGDHSSRSGASLRASCPGLEESVRWVTSMRG